MRFAFYSKIINSATARRSLSQVGTFSSRQVALTRRPSQRKRTRIYLPWRVTILCVTQQTWNSLIFLLFLIHIYEPSTIKAANINIESCLVALHSLFDSELALETFNVTCVNIRVTYLLRCTCMRTRLLISFV